MKRRSESPVASSLLTRELGLNLGMSWNAKPVNVNDYDHVHVVGLFCKVMSEWVIFNPASLEAIDFWHLATCF